MNPELDIHIDPNSIAFPALKDPLSMNIPSSIPPKQATIQPTAISKENDYQLALIPSSDSSSSSISDIEVQGKEMSEDSDMNTFLQSCGLPVLHFSQMKADEKDEFVRPDQSVYSSTNHTFAK